MVICVLKVNILALNQKPTKPTKSAPGRSRAFLFTRAHSARAQVNPPHIIPQIYELFNTFVQTLYEQNVTIV